MQKDIHHIIQQYQAKIFKTCLGFTANAEEAKDLLQEVCINLWLGLEKFREEAELSTWIYRVTVNTCLMYKRKRRITTLDISKLPKVDNTQLEVPTSDEEDLKLLQQFIAELPEKERIIIVLYLEELSYEAISEILGISVNYVGVKINRTKKILTKKFKNYGRLKKNLE